MSNVTPLLSSARKPAQIFFDRLELNAILNVYGRMVAAGQWRDYAIEMNSEAATFSAFRRASERPEIQIVKRPSLRLRQGIYALVGEAGGILKRGQELRSVLAPIERKLLKVVEN